MPRARWRTFIRGWQKETVLFPTITLFRLSGSLPSDHFSSQFVFCATSYSAQPQNQSGAVSVVRECFPFILMNTFYWVMLFTFHLNLQLPNARRHLKYTSAPVAYCFARNMWRHSLPLKVQSSRLPLKHLYIIVTYSDSEYIVYLERNEITF